MNDHLLDLPNYFTTAYFWITSAIAIIVAYVGVSFFERED